MLSRGKKPCMTAAQLQQSATSATVARRALKLIEVDYEVLPRHRSGSGDGGRCAILHDNMITEGVDPAPTKASNVAKRVEFGCGDVEEGFEQPTLLSSASSRRPFTRAISSRLRRKLFRSGTADGARQGHFVVRGHCAKLVGMEV